jgi:hypothetical protein
MAFNLDRSAMHAAAPGVTILIYELDCHEGIPSCTILRLTVSALPAGYERAGESWCVSPVGQARSSGSGSTSPSGEAAYRQRSPTYDPRQRAHHVRSGNQPG